MKAFFDEPFRGTVCTWAAMGSMFAGGGGASAAGGTAGTATAGSTAGYASMASSASSIFSSSSIGVGALGSAFASMYQAGVTGNNATIALQNERAALSGGVKAETNARIAGTELGGQMKVAQAANNVDVGSGSPAATRQSESALSTMNALTIRYNAARQAYGYGIEYTALKEQQHLEHIGTWLDIAGAVTGIPVSYFGGAVSQEGQALSYQQSGLT